MEEFTLAWYVDWMDVTKRIEARGQLEKTMMDHEEVDEAARKDGVYLLED